MESEAKKSNDMLERVSNLEELCRALNTKLDSSIISAPITSPQDNPTSHTLTNIGVMQITQSQTGKSKPCQHH